MRPLFSEKLDLKLEAANTNLTRKNFANSEELYIPEVFLGYDHQQSHGSRKN